MTVRTRRPFLAWLAVVLIAVPSAGWSDFKLVAQSAAAAPAQLAQLPWPRHYTTANAGRITVYQPQTSSWENQRRLVAGAAVAYLAKPADVNAKPAYGTLTLEADTSVALEQRQVKFARLRVTDASFKTLQKDAVREIVNEIVEAIPDQERVISLDAVLAAIARSSITPKELPGLKADPPAIFFSSTPALLVNFDSEPIWSPIEKNDLKFAVNTNWDVFQYEAAKTFYLRNENTWFKAADVKGPWQPAGKLPPSFASLPSGDNFKDVKAALPGASISASKMPKVFVSLTPAEMILTAGAPVYKPVAGTSLMWLSNTDSDVFRVGATGNVYYLVAGRWFTSASFEGPWTFATPNLPADFKKIPLEHERSRVLASVPGTEEAIEAVLLAQIPQTARVSKSQTKPEAVAYQGDPKFEKIDPTSVQRAVNTDKDVFVINGVYYYCYNGVWFTGTSANGPWQVATSVPQEIYKIPASSSSHHVTYVTIEEDDDDSDDWVAVAAAAGFMGVMIGWGCAVWGSGWYYPPYVGYGGFYPAYYPHYGSYGYSAWYNPWNGTYGRSARAYGPYGGAGMGARYNPRTGTYARGAAAYGPGGARGYATAYNPRTGAVGQTRQGSGVYGSWGSTQVQRGDDWASTSRVTNRATGTTTRVTRTDQGGAVSRTGPGGASVVAGSGGDVYAGRDGNVYRKDSGGSWQKYDNGSWNTTDRQPQRGGTDAATMGQLDRDSAARSSGASRTRDYSGVSRSSGAASRGQYRAGGASRGGGGRRR